MRASEGRYLYQGVVDWEYRGDPASVVEWRQRDHTGTASSALYNEEERAAMAARRIARRYMKDSRFRAFPSVERFPADPAYRERRRGVTWISTATAIVSRL